MNVLAIHLDVLISVKVLKKYWGVDPQSIVHVGAHNAEELETYNQAGWGPVIWIEAQPSKVRELSNRLPRSHRLIEAAVWDVDDIDLNLNVMTNTESTSLLSLGTHAKEHPTVTFSHTIPVKTKTLKNLLNNFEIPELLALDIQGVELRAIKGYGSEIASVKWVYCEVNKAELYEGCCLISEIDEYLSQYGFSRAVTRWTIHNWGDALYENRNLVPRSNLSQKISRSVVKISWAFDSTISKLKKLARRFLN